MTKSDKNLKRTTEHIYYEMMMFHYTTETLRRIVDQSNVDIQLVNAVLESWSMHLRNLLTFFYTPRNKRYKDDVLAVDYVSSLSTFRNNRTKVKTFSNIKKRVAKQFAHLTYHRNVYNQKTKVWQFARTYAQMHPTMVAFYETLPEPYKKWPHFVEVKKVIDAGY